MPAESMDRPGPGCHFSRVRSATSNQVFLSGAHRNSISINNERVTALHDDHIFIEFVNVGGGDGGFDARPQRHLASVCPVENIALDAGSCLIGRSDPILSGSS